MLRRLGIRGKILAALSVPVLVLFALAGVLSWQAIQEARTTRAVDGVVKTLAVARQLNGALQDERSLSDRLFGPTASGVINGQLESQRKTTDEAIKRLDASVASLDTVALDPAVGVAFATLKSQLGILDSARSLVDSGQVALTTIDNSYASLLHAVASAPKNVAEGINDRPLANILTTNADVSLLIEGYRHESALGREVLAGDRNPAVESSLQSRDHAGRRPAPAAERRAVRLQHQEHLHRGRARHRPEELRRHAQVRGHDDRRRRWRSGSRAGGSKRPTPRSRSSPPRRSSSTASPSPAPRRSPPTLSARPS